MSSCSVAELAHRMNVGSVPAAESGIGENTMTANEPELKVLTHFDRETFAALMQHNQGWCLACRHVIPDVAAWLRGGKCPVCERPGVWGVEAALHDELMDFDVI